MQRVEHPGSPSRLLRVLVASRSQGAWRPLCGGSPSAAMRPQPSRTVRPRAVLSTCSSSFMRSTGAVAVRLTAPATPAEHAETALEKQGWVSAGDVVHPSTLCTRCGETETAQHADARMQPLLRQLLRATPKCSCTPPAMRMRRARWDSSIRWGGPGGASSAELGVPGEGPGVQPAAGSPPSAAASAAPLVAARAQSACCAALSPA